ncbi:DMT family transporter [uncultured Parolsenella sp.]|uniref:DMT family transporter n=1 Tax=uncultured Parolsenella sp. TaxID=2083008 RepID=UPI0025CD48A5|nr:DMT family transporter [uncultured Parolsenella sp.]
MTSDNTTARTREDETGSPSAPADTVGNTTARTREGKKRAGASETPEGPATGAASDEAGTPLLRRTWMVALLAGISCLLWGSAPAAIKIGYSLFGIPNGDIAGEILFAGCRFVLAGLIALALGSAMAGRPTLPARASLPMVLKLSMFQTVGQYVCYYIGVSNTSGVKSAILVSLNTFFSILVATLLFRQERLTGRKMVGCALGIAGVVLVNLTGTGFDASMRWDGEGLVVAAGLSYAMSSVLISRYSQREDPLALSGGQFVVGGLVMVALGLALGGRMPQVSGAAVANLIYLGFVSGIAYSLWALLLKHNPVSRVSVFGSMNPVFGVIISALLLGETNVVPAWQCVLALALVVAGIWVVNRQAGEKTERG